MADLGRDLVQRRSQHGKRRNVMRMPVALDHLRCHRRGLQPQTLADADLMLRLQVTECAHRAGKLADTHILCRRMEAH
jgi:hypothetical protein